MAPRSEVRKSRMSSSLLNDMTLSSSSPSSSVPVAHSLGSGSWEETSISGDKVASSSSSPSSPALHLHCHLHGQQEVLSSPLLPPDDGWDPAFVKAVAESWNLTTDKYSKLIELGRRLQDVAHSHKNTADQVIRFLEDRSWNVAAAETMFRKMLAWRQQVDADHAIVPPQDVIENIPGAILQGVDKEGDFIYVDRCADADAIGLIERYGAQMLLQHSMWSQELIQQHLLRKRRSRQEQQGNTCNKIHRQVLVVSDMSGLSRRHLHPKVLTTFGRIARTIQDNYPISKRLIVIRANLMYRLIWSLVKHFIDSHIAHRIIVCGCDEESYKAVLQQYVDLEVLPSVLVDEGKGVAVEGFPQNFTPGPLPPAPTSSGDSS